MHARARTERPASTEPAAVPGRARTAARGRTLLALLLLVAATCAVHGRVLRYDFLDSFDDDVHVTANPHMVPPGAAGLARFWSRQYADMYVPVTYSFWMLETWLAGGSKGDRNALDARVFRLGSLLLHAAASGLVYLLLRRILDAEVPALLGALLFELHPLQVEAVAWISETRGLLAAVLGLGALVVHAGPPSLPRRSAALALLALALLAKPSAAAVPLLALVLDVAFLERRPRASLLALVPWFALVAALALVAKALQPDAIVDTVVAWSERPWIAADALGFYLRKLVLPLGLVPDQGHTPERVLAGSAWPAVLAVAVLALGFLPKWRRAPWIRGCTLLFLAGLAPVLGLVPFAHQNISTVASRFAYLALLGPSLALAAFLARTGRRGPALGLVGAGLAALGALSFVQAGTWPDLRTLFERNLRLQPDSRLSHDLVGMALEAEGDYEGAYEHFQAALRLGPRRHESHLNLGNLRVRQGRTEEGLEHYRAALESAPDYAKARRNLARILMAQRRWAEAEPHLLALVAQDVDDVALRLRLGRTRWWQGDFAGAAQQLEHAHALAPGDVAASLDLAWLLATVRAPSLRNPARARELVAALGPLDGPQEAERLWVLAAATAAEAGPQAALELAAEARRLVDDRPVLVARFDAWLDALRAGIVPDDQPPLP